ncbi:hypothetical protein [Erysipelothrix rhusiopathiae]|uniref:hypothetical protein n=1 Tax=Erysipelothrix rhusiopathiae TaxID=1648 RepID=UPI000F43423B|nr:hypothetical protein [Erysipelothrix rhusiopathiae]AYV34779.1 hypothetical protein EEY85_05505 [Erysipelothrix rhusiopathiae]MDE8332849.1 hypothetical protein [Erysipelothrix rhusiopathiae]
MKIEIENFCNIRYSSFDLSENKLNFIYGISGSGKSSIALALNSAEEDLNTYKTFGSDNQVNVVIKPELEFAIFNDDRVEELIISKTGVGIYDVVYGENKISKEKRKKLEFFLKEDVVVDIKSIINAQEERILRLESELGIKRTKTNKISNTNLYKELGNPKKYEDSNPEISVNEKEWIREGFERYFQGSICPFCKQNVTDEIVKRIIVIANELPETHQKIINAEKQLNDIGIFVDFSKINNIEVQKELKKEIDKYYKIYLEMIEIEDVFGISFNDEKSLDKKSSIKLSDETVNHFETFDVPIQSILDSFNDEKEGYLKYRKDFNSTMMNIIKENINKINKAISSFDINYKLVKNTILNINEKYELRHKLAEMDTTKNLSTGEKNIIALILFIISSENKHVIIDDPASSYDEYRREQILNFIVKSRYLDEVNKKTTVILSHDQIFLKFLTRKMEINNQREHIGFVYHFENIDGIGKLQEIHKKDMDYLINHIKKRIESSKSYLQTIINLRLYYELYDCSSIEYSYLSAILHSERDELTKEKLHEQLLSCEITEADVIDAISTETGKRILEYEKPLTFSNDELCKFEKICFFREISIGNDKKNLSSVVHFNYAMQHILNPYLYNFQSIASYEIIEKLESEMLK